MILTIQINMDNAAFEEESGIEAARILRRLAGDVEDHDLMPGESWKLRDINGNTVGLAEVEE